MKNNFHGDRWAPLPRSGPGHCRLCGQYDAYEVNGRDEGLEWGVCIGCCLKVSNEFLPPSERIPFKMVRVWETANPDNFWICLHGNFGANTKTN